MTLPEHPAAFQGTRRLAVSPRVIAQLAARSYAQDVNQSGVLLGWWPGGPELLLVEAAIARGDPAWRSQLGEPPPPLNGEPAFGSGGDAARTTQPDFWLRRVGYWAVLPGTPANPQVDCSPDEVYDVLSHVLHQAAFQKLVQETGGREGPHVTLVFRDHGGITAGHAHVVDPVQGTRPLSVVGPVAWPTRRPRPSRGVAFPPFRLPGDDDDGEAEPPPEPQG